MRSYLSSYSETSKGWELFAPALLCFILNEMELFELRLVVMLFLCYNIVQVYFGACSMKCLKLGENFIEWRNGGYQMIFGEYSSHFLVDINEQAQANTNKPISFQSEYLSLEVYENYEILMENMLCRMYNVENRRLLVYRWHDLTSAVGFWLEDLEKDSPVTIYFHPWLKTISPINSDKLLGMIGLHHKLLQRNAPIIHASYIIYNGRALLFTAPSGTGKSTQAGLWQENSDARIINGDRVLLEKRNSVWYACGYPCCGSSDICFNEDAPVEAIVVLQQAEENRLSELSAAAKQQALVTATEFYHWDSMELQKAFSLSEDIISSVPVVKLLCRPDREAVELLRRYLEGER